MQGASGLFGSAILETAIGLAFLYFMLSVVCSSVTELFASVFLWRAKDLEKALLDLLGSGKLFDSVTTHPLISALSHNEGGTKQRASQSTGNKSVPGRPAYLPARTFSLALLDSVVNRSSDGSRKPLTVDTLTDGIKTLTELEEKNVGQALLTLLEDSRDPRAAAVRIDTLKTTISKLPVAPGDESKLRVAHLALLPLRDLTDLERVVNDTLGFDPELRDTALGLVANTSQEIQGAAYSIDRLQTNVETWYDNAMDRMSGLYKRNIQVFLLVIGAIVTVATGADTLHFATTLFANPTLRTDLAATANTTGQQAQPALLTSSQAVNSLAPFSLLFGYDDVRQAVQAQATTGAPASAEQASPPLFWTEKVAGLAITVFAIMLGGPFWFQILQKLVNVRGSGPKPERADATRAKQSAAAVATVGVSG